jgi:hypothetical protein
MASFWLGFWLASASLNIVANLYYVGRGGRQKSAMDCALDASMSAAFAAWFYFGSGMF